MLFAENCKLTLNIFRVIFQISRYDLCWSLTLDDNYRRTSMLDGYFFLLLLIPNHWNDKLNTSHLKHVWLCNFCLVLTRMPLNRLLNALITLKRYQRYERLLNGSALYFLLFSHLFIPFMLIRPADHIRLFQSCTQWVELKTLREPEQSLLEEIFIWNYSKYSLTAC